MNGAETLVRTLVNAGVEVCFGNPGTSEMHFVATLDRVDGMRPVLCLFEGVVSGAADGYGRMARKPAATLLHLGPGLGNAWANLHNARRGMSPIVNVVGDHARPHLQYDAPLTSDVKSLAQTCSHWVHVSTSARSAATDGTRAVHAALSAPGQIATLILPADVAWEEAAGEAPALPVPTPLPFDARAVERAAGALKAAGKKAAILIRGEGLLRDGLMQAGRVAEATGAKLLCDTFVPRLTRGAGLPVVERIPYFAEQIVDFLAEFELLVLVGAQPPVSFFAYPGKPSWCTPEGAAILQLTAADEDQVGALAALAEAVGAGKPTKLAPHMVAPPAEGALNQMAVGMVVGRFMPEGAVLIDEAATNSLGPSAFTANAAPHDYLGLTGGSIGWGISISVGAAVACPGRKVVCLHGDGGAMYTIQALWTMAREKLDVCVVVFANRSYSILNIELSRVGAGNGGPKSHAMLNIGDPALDFCKLAEGMGVAASRATTAEEFAAQFEDAMRQSGPRVIEVML